MRTSKRLVGLVAIGAAALLVATACGKSTSGGTTEQKSISLAECESKPNECNSGPGKAGGTIVQAMEKTLVNWNVNSAKGNILDVTSVLNGVLPSSFLLYPDNTAHLNTDLLVSAELTSKDPQTLVYKIQPNASWDDGTPISAQDLIYAWHTLNNKDCPDCDAAGTTGYDQIKSITGSDNDKTATVVFSSNYPDWQGLFSGLYPAHIAKKYGDDGTAAGLKKAWETFKTTQINYTGWAYKISEYTKDVSITLVPNDKFYGKNKATLDKVIFRIITDQTQQLPALKNKEVNLLQSQPSQAIVDQVRQTQGVDYAVTPGVAWEHFTVNTKNKFLADLALRKAIFTAVDRKAIISKTLSFFSAAKPLDNHMLLPSQPGYQGNIGDLDYGNGNVEKAKKILTDAGYKVDPSGLKTKSGETVPPLKVDYTKGNEPRQQAVLLLQAQLKPLGINVAVTPIDSLGDALDNHDFDIIIFAFVGGPYLTANVDLWKTGGGGNYSQISDPKIDDLMKQVASELDAKKATDLLNQADKLVFEDAADLSLFQKPNFLAVSHEFVNIRPNGTQMTSTYNIEQWATRAPQAK